MSAVIVTTPDELRMLIREEVERALGHAAPDVMDTRQAAAYANRSAKTIRSWIRAGMPANRKGGRIFIQRADLDRWRANGNDPIIASLRSVD